MAVLQGGIFSRPRGKTGGIVFGAARTRSGKLVTSRLLVPPSNPNTAAQQTQRSKFKQCQTIVRTLGAACYQNYFNRSIGQLPGFQSMQSIFMNQMDSDLDLSLTLPINLGTLHFPDECVVDGSGPSEIDVTITTELGSNGTSADLIGVIIIPQATALRGTPGYIVFDTQFTRAEPGGNFTGFEAGTYEVYVFMIGQGTAAGLLSVSNPYEVTLS